MTPASGAMGIEVYLEFGAKRTFACAVDWPGWCRSGAGEAVALEALLEYGPRYGAVVGSARLGFKTPKAVTAFRVAERLEGNATTDFGAPGVIPKVDRAKATPADCARFEKVLRAAWRALDAARRRATGKELRKGPRGGGRELDGIVNHVIEADLGYLTAVGWKVTLSGGPDDRIEQVRGAIIEAIGASARGEIAATGPRGGVRWPVRYYVRRAAWHTIAHVWEIERRTL
jgi:hypothetical protein